jgi:hypothetical protein
MVRFLDLFQFVCLTPPLFQTPQSKTKLDREKVPRYSRCDTRQYDLGLRHQQTEDFKEIFAAGWKQVREYYRRIIECYRRIT